MPQGRAEDSLTILPHAPMFAFRETHLKAGTSMGENARLGTARPGIEFCLCYILETEPWASHTISLSFSFLSVKWDNIFRATTLQLRVILNTNRGNILMCFVNNKIQHKM